MNPKLLKILSTALAVALILAIVGLLAAIWAPGLIVRQPPPSQQIPNP
jgi:hypothetical protein